MAPQLASIVYYLLTALMWAMFGRAILSWFDPHGRWSISRVLRDVTEPFVAPIRRVIPAYAGFDLSFIAAGFLLLFLRRLLVQALIGN